MDIDDVLTYISAVDLTTKGMLTVGDLEVIYDTVIEDSEMALNQAISLFLGQLEYNGISWEDLRDCWLYSKDRGK